MRDEYRHANLLTGSANTDLDEPRPLPEAVETELVGDLSSVHGVGEILLVSENKQEGITELILVEHPLELLTGLRDTFPIVGVDDEDDTLGVLEVCDAEKEGVGEDREDTSDAEDVQCLQRGRILSCPPTSHTVNEMFLYSTVSTLKPAEESQKREDVNIGERGAGSTDQWWGWW